MSQTFAGNQEGSQQPISLSVCIVSNRLDKKLEEIIEAVHSNGIEILIGYDGDISAVPSTFNALGYAKIHSVTWQGYSITKNELTTKATADWILSLDSDEVPNRELMAGLLKLPFSDLAQNQIFSIKRISFFEGKKIMHGAWGRDRVLRLYHKKYTQWDNAIVHESLQKKEDTIIKQLPGILLHYTADDYESFLVKNKNYARLSALKYFTANKKSPYWKRILSPVFTFIKEYIFQGGFLDGNAGIKIARINALYTYWKYDYLRQKYQD
ncbi:MAG: glycosyltransferase family 2 protein [Taibaiella sp.]